jgi:hypothetical protein
MTTQTLSLKQKTHFNNLQESALRLKEVLGHGRKSVPWDTNVKRMPISLHQGRAKEKFTSRVLMTILLCMMMLSTHCAPPTCFKYPRYFASFSNSNYILSMDMHFESDLLVYVGDSKDYNLNRNNLCYWCSIPVVASMSIADPIFKWTLAAIQW